MGLSSRAVLITVSTDTRGRHYIIACTKQLHTQSNICCYDKSRLFWKKCPTNDGKLFKGCWSKYIQAVSINIDFKTPLNTKEITKLH